jgi:NTE family protein
MTAPDAIPREARSRPAAGGTTDRGGLAVVLAGGGARAAYQVGVLRFLARRFPELRVPILTGVSAGAVSAAHLAQHPGPFSAAVDELAALWGSLSPERVFRVDSLSLARNVFRSGTSLLAGGARHPRVRGMVDTEPLRELLTVALAPAGGPLAGIRRNLERGRLQAVAISTTSYTTGQSVIWVEGRDIETWERPMRRSVHTRLTVEHIMASAALPLLFPAVRLGEHWYGDGGVRLTAPLSPALHLGAHKILAVSPRYALSPSEADRPAIIGYPPPIQVLGVLYNSVFLDLIDQDVERMRRMNQVLRALPETERAGMRVVELLVIRPSRDLGRLARHHEPRLPGVFRYLSRGLGSRQTLSPDLLSMVMFQADYLHRLMELGEADAEARSAEIADFLAA